MNKIINCNIIKHLRPSAYFMSHWAGHSKILNSSHKVWVSKQTAMIPILNISSLVFITKGGHGLFKDVLAYLLHGTK